MKSPTPGIDRLHHVARAAVAVVVLLAASACSTLPKTADKQESRAFTDTDDTRIARIIAGTRPSSVGESLSGLQLVSRGDEAFGLLYTLIERAERSLDLQYYIIKDDPYSRALLRAARSAADRGVRVRVLLDDFYTTGLDQRIAWYAAHPNIDVRLFNPFAHGRSWFATRVMTSLLDLDRVDRRMHNKLFVVDNALAVTGGRNVGAEYYMHSGQTNFLDLDVMAGGPVVQALSATFDRYWNSRFAVPIESLTNAIGTSAVTADSRAAADPDDPVRKATDVAKSAGGALADQLDRGTLPMTWADTVLIADKPSKIGRTAPQVDAGALVAGSTIASDVLAIAAAAQSDLIIISPYFVPGERGVAALRALVERGVKVRVLTNSLAATDAAIVHIGYAHYRKALIALGVEIYELRPDPSSENTKLGGIGSSKASLHAKVLVVDHKTLFVGSFNVDQRSALENTEMGLAIQSPELAEQVFGVLRDRGVESRYRVTIGDDGNLLWTTQTRGIEQVFHDEPGASATLIWSLKLLTPFAPEELL